MRRPEKQTAGRTRPDATSVGEGEGGWLEQGWHRLRRWWRRRLVQRVGLVPLGVGDVEAMSQIERRCFSVPWSQESFREELTANPRAFYLGAKLGQRLLGYVGVWLLDEEGQITNCAVDPSWQGLGVGGRLLAGLLAEAFRRGARRLTLEVRRGNTGAQRFYRRFGFREVGVRPRYYLDNGEDAVIMWCELPDGSKP